MKSKPLVFISYSYDDIDKDTLLYFKYLLEQYSEGSYDILFDDDLPIGSDLNEFMKLIDTVIDAILILMTPSYKRKILDKRGGVYEEFKRIMYRYDNIQKEKRDGRKSGEIEGYFKLFPILFSGDTVRSVPDQIKHLKYLNLIGLSVICDSKGCYKISEYVSKMFLPQIISITESLKVVSTLKSKSFDETYKEYFNRLFLELKADWKNPRDKDLNYFKTLFVKTFSYRKVESQEVYFIIGRKGSGKTTITDAMSNLLKSKYLGHISAIADEFNLEFLYIFLNSQKIRSDMKSVFNMVNCFEFAWEAFLYLCCMEILIKAEKVDKLTNLQIAGLESIKRFLNDLKRGEWAYIGGAKNKNIYFVYCFHSVVRFIDECIKNTRNDQEYFYLDLIANYTKNNFLN